MPNYSYECQKCRQFFEMRLSIKDMVKGHFVCDKCGSQNTRRLFNGFGYFKGSSSHNASSTGCSNCQGGSCSTCNY